MALLRRIANKAKAEINTGFGTNTSAYGGRLVNKNGRPNIEKKGVGILEGVSWYHTMLDLPLWKFLSILLLFFILINFLFAGIYYAVGIEHLSGLNGANSEAKFIDAYFFSTQTFTTVGYGRINPMGFATSAIAAIEALVGLLSFALATGLFYGRFSKPEAFLKYSNNAIIAPYKDGAAFMFRISPYKNTSLTDVTAKVSIGLFIEDENEDGKVRSSFYNAPLEYSIVNSLTLSWTIVHPINEESPFYTFTAEDFAKAKGEIIVFVKAFDDMFSNEVVSRSSYLFNEIIVGAKFDPMYFQSPNHNKTILDIGKLNSYTAIDIRSVLPISKDATTA
ncbi:MAG TPA: ion channel [Ferruginibacter sp.]|jgi:inward rectifier potassium channel|nr:ion channel [Ferruginibacter sp.]